MPFYFFGERGSRRKKRKRGLPGTARVSAWVTPGRFTVGPEYYAWRCLHSARHPRSRSVRVGTSPRCGNDRTPSRSAVSLRSDSILIRRFAPSLRSLPLFITL